MALKCKPCKDRGRDHVAHRLVGDPPTPMCDSCFKGAPAPAEQTATKKEVRKMSKKVCGCGCGRTLRKDNKTGFIAGHKPGSKQSGRGRRRQNSADVATIGVTDETCIQIFAGLPLARKAALINKLPEMG